MMSDCLEVLFVSDDAGSVQCLDPRIGTHFTSYRGSYKIQPGCLSVISGSYLLAADAVKPIIHVWPLNSQEELPGPKLVLSGRATALASSPDGIHCVVAIDAKLFVFQTTSGSLLGVLSKHYREVTKIVFLSDSAHFVTCGENGSVFVWKLATAVSQEGATILGTSAVQEPVYSFSHHALRVTDAYAGPSGMSGRLYTSSLDQTVKMYDLRTGSLLLSIIFEHSLSAMCPNITESVLFVGTSKGEIVEFRMDPLPRNLDYTVQQNDIPHRYRGHDKAVTSIQHSLDGHLLITAGADGQVLTWDLPSRQQLRLFNLKGSVTNAVMTLASENLFNDTFDPNITFKNFQRVSADDSSYKFNISMRQTLVPIDYSKTKESVVIQQRVEKSDDANELKSRLEEVERKNNELYRFALEKIINNPHNFDGGEGQPKKRKKKVRNGTSEMC